MTLARASKSYGGARLQTATCLEVTCLLHERALLEIERASRAEDRGEPIRRRDAVAHARRIVLELVASIDLDQGELATSLHRLYVYAATRLSPLANVADLRVAREILGELGAAYCELRERSARPA